MNDDHVESVAQLAELVKLSKCAVFSSKDKKATYEWVGTTLSRFRYLQESKKNRSIIKAYVQMMTGYSETQVDRLIARKRETGRVTLKERTQPVFPRTYTADDIALLAEVDEAEGHRNGNAVRHTLRDMYQVYGDERFKRLAQISASHIYNLRGTRQYQSSSLHYEKTRPTATQIGERCKPEHGGKPGYLRVDSVHQGDLDKQKGVYHINLVDEVTQHEIVVTVEGISEYFLEPVLEDALAQFPFVILNFHSDNGSEYINKTVARLLQKLLIHQTKSRARHSNDNALAEGKNAAVVRHTFGRMHIPKKHAARMNTFNQKYLNPYLNFHRQCAFAEEKMDEKGKIRKVYKEYCTPTQKLLSLKEVEQYLKLGITVESLKAVMLEKTHLAAAQEMQKAKDQLFKEIHGSVVG